MDTLKLARPMLFLSTLSLRRATNLQQNQHQKKHISIHALLAESDALAMAAQSPDTHFYPRSPCGERLRWQWLHSLPIRISIHALLAESDSMILGQYCESTDFYPRSPCGERPNWQHRLAYDLAFLSTLSLRRATCRAETSESRYRHFYPRSPCGERHARRALGFVDPDISIHALLAESDHLLII